MEKGRTGTSPAAYPTKDNSHAHAEPDGKKQHGIEIMVTIDTGTSILLELAVRDDFTAETALLAVADLVRQHGLPQVVRFDRDPRFVGGAQQGDFPSAFVRFWLGLGVQVDICDPQRPQDKPFVERVNRTIGEEVLDRQRPTDVGSTTLALDEYKPHYNEERPHQGRACQNQPPLVAFPDLPERPRIPERVDPDGWLKQIDRLRFTRQVGKDGRISVARHHYYVGNAHAGQRVGVRVEAPTAELVIEAQGREVKRIALKGLHECGPIPFDEWVEQLRQEAISEQRQQPRTRRTSRNRGWMETLKTAVNQVLPNHDDPPSPGAVMTGPEADRLADEIGAPPF